MNRPSEHITHTLRFDEQNEKLYSSTWDPAAICVAKTIQNGRRYCSLILTALGGIYAMEYATPSAQISIPSQANCGPPDTGTTAKDVVAPEWISIIHPNTFHGWPFAYAYRS